MDRGRALRGLPPRPEFHLDGAEARPRVRAGGSRVANLPARHCGVDARAAPHPARQAAPADRRPARRRAPGRRLRRRSRDPAWAGRRPRNDPQDARRRRHGPRPRRHRPEPRSRPSIKLPREEPGQINPPAAADIEKVFGRIPEEHRLALLWLDWSGARVSSIDLTLVGDYDESRQRVRLRAATTKTRRALWVELHPVLAEAIEATLPHSASATTTPGCSPALAPTRSGRQSERRARPKASRCGRLTACATAGSRFCICAASPGHGSPNSSGSANCP